MSDLPPRLRPLVGRTCPQCREVFDPSRHEHRNYAKRFCSAKCANDNRSERVRRNWPTEDEMRRLVMVEKLSDAAIGERYGHSYEWARRVRNAYGIPALPKPPHREVKHGRYIGRSAFTVKRKGESACRVCGATPNGEGPFGRLNLHHAIPRSMCRATQADLLNGIPLCFECHQGWHDRRLVIYRDVFTAEEWAFLVAVELTGQEVVPWLERHYPDRGRPFRVVADAA